jgi:alpha-L-fucosidase
MCRLIERGGFARRIGIPILGAAALTIPVIQAFAYTLPDLPPQPILPAPKAPGTVAMGDPAAFPEVKMDFPIRSGPFQPTWSSIAANYPAPQPTSWLRSAKFGIWVHYGPQASLNSGDWSAQHLYQQGSAAYTKHLADFGHPTVSGYKEVLKAWNPVNYDPASLTQLYHDAGARFLLVQGVHHDNFDNWNSKYNPWNIMNFGAKRDTMAEWRAAAKSLGMRMGVAFHHEYSWWFYQPAYKSDSSGTYAGVPYDAEALRGTSGAGTWWANYDISRLYNTNLREYIGIDTPTNSYWNPAKGIFVNHLDYCHWYATQWALRIIDVIEKYDPDFIYTDGNSTQPFDGYKTSTGYKCDAMQRVLAHYYNKAIAEHGSVDKMGFVKFHYPGNGVGTTTEGGYPAGIKTDQLWVTDLSIGPWFWQSNLTFDNGTTLVHMLLETVSRDGAAIINIPIDGTGSLAGGAPAMFANVGAWMAINGEGIYGSRAWSAFREGTGSSTTSDFRFTVGENGYLYAYCMTVPAAGAQLTIHALGTNQHNLAGPITSVSMLGSSETLTWSQTATGLTITCPSTMPAVPSGTGVCFKIGPPAAIGLESPINLAAQSGAGQVNLSWTYSIFAPAATFNVKRATNLDGPYTTVATGVPGTSFADTSVDPGATYYYTVTATSAGGESAPAPYATTVTPGSVTSSWVSQDIGGVSATGSFGESNGTLTMQGSGSDVWGTADSFRYAFKAVNGDCTITARVLNMTNTATWAKAGLMIRSSLDAGASNALVFLSPANGIALQRRATAGGSTSSLVNVTGMAAPYWLRLTRVGNTFTAYRSADGATWTSVGSTTFDMPGAVFIGPMVCSVKNGTLCQAQFDNVTVATTAHLRFNESSGATATDSTGNGWNATLAGGASFAAGKSGNALTLGGSGAYAALPAGVASGLDDFTISAWVKLNSVSNWARLFDFGTGTNAYMFLSPKNAATGVVRFAITTGGSGSEQKIDGAAALPTGVWTHVAVTLSGGTGTLYVNGTAVGTNAAMTLKPSSLGATANNYIGKSQFGADPYLDGQVDDFRIVNRALTSSEIAALVTDPTAPASLSATAGNAQVALSWSAVSGASGYNVKRATTSGGPYTTIGWMLSSTSLTDTAVSVGSAYYYVVTAVNGVAESAASSEASATVLSPPSSPPGNVVATASDSQTTLSWDPVSSATSYIVRRALTSNGAYETLATVTGAGYTDAGLSNGTTYYYVVSAQNAAGVSADYSGEAAAQPLDARQVWRKAHFGQIDNTGDAANTADPDHDGRSNLLEYAVGSDPNLPDPALAGALGKTADGLRLTLTFDRIADPALTYIVEAADSPDQAVWTAIWTSTGASNTAGSVTVPDTELITAHPRRFLRLKVAL